MPADPVHSKLARLSTPHSLMTDDMSRKHEGPGVIGSSSHAGSRCCAFVVSLSLSNPLAPRDSDSQSDADS